MHSVLRELEYQPLYHIGMHINITYTDVFVLACVHGGNVPTYVYKYQLKKRNNNNACI